MCFIIFKAISNIHGIVFEVFITYKIAIKFFRQRGFADDHQSAATKVSEIGGKASMLCLVEAIHHVDVTVVIEDAVVRRIQEDEIIFLRHVKNLAIVKIEEFRMLQKLTMLLGNELRIEIGIPPKWNIVLPVAIVANHTGVGCFVDEEIDNAIKKIIGNTRWCGMGRRYMVEDVSQVVVQFFICVWDTLIW